MPESAAVAARHGGRWRTLRTGAQVWSLTVLAHTTAGGDLPSAAWMVGVAVLVAASIAWVLRGSIRLRVMLPVLTTCQVGLHLALSPGALGEHAHGGSAMSARMVVAHVLCVFLTGVIWWTQRWVIEVVVATLARPFAPIATSRAGTATAGRVAFPVSRAWLRGDPGRAPPGTPAPV